MNNNGKRNQAKLIDDLYTELVIVIVVQVPSEIKQLKYFP